MNKVRRGTGGLVVALALAAACSSSKGEGGQGGSAGAVAAGSGGAAAAGPGGIAGTGGAGGPGTGGAAGAATRGENGAAGAGEAPGTDGTGEVGGQAGGASGAGGPAASCGGTSTVDCAGTMLGPWCVDPFLIGDPAASAFSGLWAGGPSDVWAVGSRVDSIGILDTGGFAFHWDGCTWTQASIAIPAGLREVWGAARNDVWAVGTAGTALHFDGHSWTPAVTGTTSDLWSVSGTAGNDVWAIGSGGVFHWNGTAWAPSPGFPALGPNQFTGDIWAVTPGDVWTVGDRNNVVHFDGSTWTIMTASADITHSLFAVWSDGATTWAVGEGSQIQKRAGGAWTSVQGGDGSSIGFRNVMAAGKDVWAVGLATVHSTAGGPFTPDPHLPSADFGLSGLWLTATQVWGAGVGPATPGSTTSAPVVVHRAR
jgi:hypothetical protein